MLISIHGGNGLANCWLYVRPNRPRSAARKAEIELAQWFSHLAGARRVPAKLAENGRWHYGDGT